MAVYAAPFDKTDKHPKVAVVIDGGGRNQDQTRALLTDLPAAIDVAFSPYAADDPGMDKLLDLARQRGHECLVSIPMEPNNYPLADEGAHQLMQGHADEENRLDLEWALSRILGCVGVTGGSDGMTGEHFAENGLGFSEMLEEIGKRGLLYLDPRTGAPALLAVSDITPIAVVDTIIDQPLAAEQPITADLIDQRLATLEMQAKTRGSAIGLAGPPQPVMLDHINIWARGLAARGVTLVPLSALTAPVHADADEAKADDFQRR